MSKLLPIMRRCTNTNENGTKKQTKKKKGGPQKTPRQNLKKSPPIPRPKSEKYRKMIFRIVPKSLK